jgi:O-antigen ligase
MNLASSPGVEPAALAQYGALQKVSARTAKIHPVNALLIVSLAIPEEFSFFIGPLRLTITRALLLLSAPLLAQAYFQRPAGRAQLTDLLVLCASAWMFISVTIITDIGSSLSHAGPEILEFAVAYFAFRLWTKTREQVLASLDLFCLVISIAALVSVLDSLMGIFFLHDYSAMLTGYIKERQHDHRLGLLRAAGPFEHPIHLGVICGASVIIAFAAPLKRRLFYIAACSLAMVLSFSSGPLQACVMGVALVVYSRSFSRLKNKWGVMIVSVATVAGAAYLVSDSPLSFITNQLTFDPSSAWARQYEWQMAGAVVEQSPWFGIALFNWPAIAKELGTFESVDSLWLALALGYGIPGAVLVAAAVLSAACVRTRPLSNGGVADKDRQALGELLSILLILTLYLGFTVDYWASLWVFIAVLAGLRASPGCTG